MAIGARQRYPGAMSRAPGDRAGGALLTPGGPGEARAIWTVGAGQAVGASRFAGLLVATALALVAQQKAAAGVAPELLWTCHVTSALAAAGLLLGRHRLTALACLFHASVGFPAYVLDVAVHRHTTWQSALLHLFTLAATLPTVRQQGLPPRTWLSAWCLYLALLPGSYLLTPPALNVNLAHQGWVPLFGRPLGAPGSWLASATASAAALFLGERVLRRLVAPAPRSPGESPPLTRAGR